jgi:hypothetical protein
MENTNQAIIYIQDNDIPAIVIPTQEALDSIGIMAIAMKDVPSGKPFKFFDASDFPQDWPQEVFDVDMTNPDGTGADYGFGSRNAVIGWNEDRTPITQEEPQ